VSGDSACDKGQLEKTILPSCTIFQGQPNSIALWVNALAIGSSVMYQDPNTKNIGVGTKTPAAALDVNGAINTTTSFDIGGNNALSINNQSNLFAGPGAGSSNTTGTENTFAGYNAGQSNTGGFNNTFFGAWAGASNLVGAENTFYGSLAGIKNTTGNWNTFIGSSAGHENTSGGSNTFSGYGAGSSNTSGNGNTFSGFWAGVSNSTGAENTFVGDSAGKLNNSGCCNSFFGSAAGLNTTAGQFNTFIGYQSGTNNIMGTNNVYINNSGPISGTESAAIRVGDPIIHTTTFIAGIYGTPSSSGVPVYINSNGQLGTQPSSLRFKEEIQNMTDNTNALMKLRPVTFLYKPEYDEGERTLQYGLVAEDVAKVYPELVAYDNDGQPYSVRYQFLPIMLLNEAQRQYRRAEAQAEVVKAQEHKIEALEQRLQRLERLVEPRTNLASNSNPATF
jgi:hypothetical protein